MYIPFFLDPLMSKVDFPIAHDGTTSCPFPAAILLFDTLTPESSHFAFLDLGGLLIISLSRPFLIA